MTTEDQATSIIANESGYHKDLRDAEQMIVAAGDDPVKLAKAFQRHAEAQRNMLMGILIPSFQSALKPLLDDSLTPVIAGIGGLQLGQNQLNSSFQSLSETVDSLALDLAQFKRSVDVNEDVKKLRFERIEAELVRLSEALDAMASRALINELTLEERIKLVAANRWVQANKDFIVLNKPDE